MVFKPATCAVPKAFTWSDVKLVSWTELREFSPATVNPCTAWVVNATKSAVLNAATCVVFKTDKAVEVRLAACAVLRDFTWSLVIALACEVLNAAIPSLVRVAKFEVEIEVN